MLLNNLNAFCLALLKKDKNIFEELYEHFKEKFFSDYLGRYENFEFGTGKLLTHNMIILGIFAGVIIAAALSIYNKRYLGKFVRKILDDGATSPESAKTVEELGFKNHFMIRLGLMGGKSFGKMIRCVEADEYYAEMLGENSAFPPTSPQKTQENEQESTEQGRGFDQNPEKSDETDENRGSGCDEAGESPDERHDRLLRSVKPYKIDVEHDRFYIKEEDRYSAEFRYKKKGTNWLVFVLIVIFCIFLADLVSFLLPDMIQLVDNFLTEVKK